MRYIKMYRYQTLSYFKELIARYVFNSFEYKVMQSPMGDADHLTPGHLSVHLPIIP